MIMPGPDGEFVRSSGGQVDEMTLALIDAAYDKDSTVQESVANSLFDLGRKKTALVLSSCYSYLKKHSKLSQGHRVVILQVMERIIKENLDSVDPSLSVDLIKQASEELTQSKEVVPEWQTAASGVLVALGKKYCNEVMEVLLEKFQPGILPHFFVVQTMANLASANVYGMVPHLTAVLGTMLPMLGMAKQDNIRWVFSSALSKFSEAILDYIANIDKAPDNTVTKEVFAGEIFSAYDILFNVWLQSKEAKLRLAIIEAVGHMTHLIGRDKLEEQLPRLLQGILGLYKRHPEPYHITQGLAMILDAVCEEGSVILEPHLDILLNVLFTQVCVPCDYTNPMAMKNHNELLRCFAVMARCFSGRIIGFLLQKLEAGNERIKLGALSVFRHLINAATASMEDKKEVIVSGLKMVASDNNNKVKKMFAQVVIAMAHHGYLELEGGQLMVEFIVRQCALLPDPPGKRSADPEYVSNDQLRQMCANILQLITTTIELMESVLWPYLLELVIPETYTDAAGTLCKSLAYLAKKKREENADDFEIDFESDVNLPKPPILIARLMVLAGRPTNGNDRGIHVLTLMQYISPNLHENLVSIWDTVIPKLVHFLEDAVDSDKDWSQKNWEDLILKMLSKSLDEVQDEDWIAELGEAFGQQIPLYSNMPEEKNFLFKCLGIVCRKSTKKEFVIKHLDLIFSSVRHNSQVEREGCAIALGFCASSHLDAVLSKLDSVVKTDLSKKSGGLLSFMKQDKSDGDTEKIKATLMLCYGFVTLYSPPSLIVSRMEATILRTINPYLVNVKDYSVKQNLIRTMELIAKALHPSHLQTQYTFTKRGDLLTHLQSYMRGESTSSINNETRALAMNACAELVKLEPCLPEAEIFELVKTALDCVFPLPPDGVSAKKNKEEAYKDMLDAEVLMNATMEALHDLIKELLIKNVSPGGMDSIYKQLVPWILSLHEHERERALNTCLMITDFYLENMTQGIGDAVKFDNLGRILARLIPRCTDPCVTVRQLAIDCVQNVLRIHLRYEGSLPDEKDQMVEALPTLKERLKKTDPNVLFGVVNDLAKVVSKKLPADQLQVFLEGLFEGLIDPQSHSSSGACVVLNGILKARGTEVVKEVSSILLSLHQKLSVIEVQQTRTGTLRSIRTMSSHHLIPVLTSLLTFPLPFDDNVVEIWKILSQDPVLVSRMIEHILELLQRSLPYEEKPGDKERPQRTAMPLPLAATSALTEIFNCEETEEVVMKNFHRLFAALILRIGSMINVKPPKGVQLDKKEEVNTKDKKSANIVRESKKTTPCSLAVVSFRALLVRAQSTDMIELLDKESVWQMFEDEDRYAEAMSILARAIATHHPEQVPQIIASLTSALSSLYEPQRAVVAAFFSEMINQKCAGDSTLIELVMNSLLGRLVDSSQQVRKLCIRGLGNVSSISSKEVQKYSTTVLSAMMAGMDDKEDPDDDITLEAMSGLSKVLSEIDESHIRAILINVALRIRPCFEKDKPSVRAQAVILFGNLSRFGDGPSKAPFLEQIHSNLVSLLLHLNDPEPEVRKACKYSLRLLGPLLGSEDINDKFQKHLLEDANLFYGEFMNDLSKLLIKDFPEKINFYVMGCVSFFKTIWPEIKSNAAIFAGFLLGNLPKDKHSNISKEHVCAALILLLKDQSANVRVKAAEAISLLHEY
ncbi:maestro heat-like repeat-containing protein family member 1 [Liolophura sinensis]|uniref:maestro heat-like repeat-containing protein family member 1 n=1 Tax=Liolophura sinensis TaxID=3198878 RepID=UPI003158326C